MSERSAGVDDEIGVWRKLIEMVSGESAVVTRLEHATLRPPLEPSPEAGSVALPERIELLPSREQNRSLYRFLALQVAGRREFGTYLRAKSGATVRDLLPRDREQPDRPSALEDVFLVVEGVRVQARIADAYPGSVAETAAVAAALLEGPHEAQPSLACVYDTLLALALVPALPVRLPRWLPPATAERVRRAFDRVRRPEATAFDSLALARRLLVLFATPAFSGETSQAAPGAVALCSLAVDGAAIEQELQQAARAAPAAAAPGTSPVPVAHDAWADEIAENGSNAAADGGDTTTEPDIGGVSVRERPRASPSSQTYLYDEWDHTVGNYRSRYCRVHELALPRDSGAFFERTRLAYAGVLGQVRHQFERIRPERYRPLRGLPDGEDIDLNAVIEARIEARARRSPHGRVYTARTRQQRDVATLFLVDMSASTEQPYAEPGDPAPHRIIDTLKEALVVMSSALDDLGDSYAIYGFSSHGRDRVEVYPVKAFAEPLGPEVKARIGSIVPKNGTRMGAALRHILTKFGASQARSKHLILLSDGFPQDQEYGPDRRSHSYGIRDTAIALRELGARGVMPFCITVDRAGNDYLREMCAPEQYLIIEHLDDLPRELPKIYRRVVQS